MSWYRSRHAGPSVTPALPTQQKTVTATTSQQVVTPDSGYVLDQVTVNPQEHTASFTPTANLVGASGNANDMGLNHNKRYVNTSGMITPSGTKSITSNGTHDVSSYANASVSVDASGTPITPSNSSPARIYSGSTYTATSSGYAIGSYSSVTPSNSSPVLMSSGSIYKPNGNGYAISSYSSVTPSSSGAYFSSGMVKMSSSGYAYSSRPSASFTETLLWTNSTSSKTFSAQTITVNNLKSYDYFKLVSEGYKVSTGTSYSAYCNTEYLYSYINMGQFDEFEEDQTTIGVLTDAYDCSCIIMSTTGQTEGVDTLPKDANTTYTYIRPFWCTAYNKIYFSNCYKLGSSTTNNNYCIPYKIYGCKLTS